MKTRSFLKFILIISPALLLTWAWADHWAQAKEDPRLILSVGSADNMVFQSSNRGPLSLGHTTDITFTPAFTGYLPVIINPPPGIFGRVTYQGSPIEGITLTLQLWEAGSSVAVLTTTTQSDGGYLFTDVPDLDIDMGKSYVVRYMNNGDPRFLGYWYSDFLNHYTANTRAAGGNFDIADIVLTSPSNGAIVSLPYTFQWIPRPTTPSDNYHVMLACRSTGNRSYFEIGYSGSFYLGYPPQDCTDYWWLINVTPQGLILGGTGGVSYEFRAVSFSGTFETILPKALRRTSGRIGTSYSEWKVSFNAGYKRR